MARGMAGPMARGIAGQMEPAVRRDGREPGRRPRAGGPTGATVAFVDPLTRLLLEARAGDTAALSRFIAETQPAIWRFCAHLVGPDSADDATQETYLAAWRALPGWRGDSSARTWLFVIARRSAERVSRRGRRWRELASGAPLPRPSHDPGAASELADLLGHLDADRRSAIVLTQVLGFSYAEAAEICQCVVGTIRSRVARAREQLVALERHVEGREAGAP